IRRLSNAHLAGAAPLLNRVPWNPEPLAALMPASASSVLRFVQFRCREDTIAADAAAEPRRIWLLIGERTGFHRAELGRKQLGIAAADAKYNKRTGITDHCGSDSMRQLIGVLIRQCEVRCKLAGFRQQGRECVRAEGLKLIHMYKKRYAILRR